MDVWWGGKEIYLDFTLCKQQWIIIAGNDGDFWMFAGDFLCRNAKLPQNARTTLNEFNSASTFIHACFLH